MSSYFLTSAVEARHSEVLKDTQATISCVVTGLTKQLDAVSWEKPNSGGAITHDVDGYQIDVGTYQDGSNSQTTILTIPSTANMVDAVFPCIITSNEHRKSEDATNVNSNVFSKNTFLSVISFIHEPRNFDINHHF